eukprot:365047-Chlamydomonas_euryale.AAC.14
MPQRARATHPHGACPGRRGPGQALRQRTVPRGVGLLLRISVVQSQQHPVPPDAFQAALAHLHTSTPSR